MAPEQARNAHAVDARADVFGLGATLFFAITGQAPFTDAAGVRRRTALGARRSVRTCPPGSTRSLSRMMAADAGSALPDGRGGHAGAAAVPARRRSALHRARGEHLYPLPHRPRHADGGRTDEPKSTADAVPSRVLIVDDQPDIRRLCRVALAAEGLACDEAGAGPDAIDLAAKAPYDLVLLDVDLPGFSGEEVLRRLRQRPPTPHLKVVMFSGAASGDELSRILLAGADDFLTKPFSMVQLRARVKAALRLKDAQDRSDVLNRELLRAQRRTGTDRSRTATAN